MNITIVVTGIATVVSLLAAGAHWDWGQSDGDCGDGLLVHVGIGHHHSSPPARDGGSASPSSAPQDCSDGP